MSYSCENEEVMLKKEKRSDGILLSFDEQAALDCAIELHQLGILKTYSFNVLGTLIESIQIAKDRFLFTQKMASIGEKFLPYEIVNLIDEALISAERLGYPVLVRDASARDNLPSSFADKSEKLKSLFTSVLSGSSQLFMNKSVKG
ncbi:unnamed protein product [Rotaria sp. Silwood2]|nr:unnamed protein product [Rotaria sp. Silwood2]CAF4226947.1 unnamed protein product [Rotaria sp. Silwood2]